MNGVFRKVAPNKSFEPDWRERERLAHPLPQVVLTLDWCGGG